MIEPRTRQSISGFLLVLPLIVFLIVFFCWPLATIISQAVYGPAVARALPSTSAAMRDWDQSSPVTQEIEQAFVADLRAISDRQELGGLVMQLNNGKAGFRTLMMKTVTAVTASAGPVTLAGIDPRWGELEYWRVIARSLPVYTDRYLLAAIDMSRSDSGEIVSLPPGMSANAQILARTLLIATTVTLTCLLIGFPYAILAASVTGWKRNVLLAAVLLPLITSLLVRTAAWYMLLQDKGIINGMLRWLDFPGTPVHLLFNRGGVIIAMTHILLPFMVLPIYSVLTMIPGSLMPAAASLGANPLRAFLLVLLPLSLRGVASGALLVFITALGYYITPALLGGPNDQMISSVIAFYGLEAANWGMAGALSIILLMTTIVLYVVYDRISSAEEA